MIHKIAIKRTELSWRGNIIGILQILDDKSAKIVRIYFARSDYDMKTKMDSTFLCTYSVVFQNMQR